MMALALFRKKPADRISCSSSVRSATAKAAAVGYFRKSPGVIRLTRSSVHWAASRLWFYFFFSYKKNNSSYNYQSKNNYQNKFFTHSSFFNLFVMNMMIWVFHYFILTLFLIYLLFYIISRLCFIKIMLGF